jgi:hypothetical protein
MDGRQALGHRAQSENNFLKRAYGDSPLVGHTD